MQRMFSNEFGQKKQSIAFNAHHKPMKAQNFWIKCNRTFQNWNFMKDIQVLTNNPFPAKLVPSQLALPQLSSVLLQLASWHDIICQNSIIQQHQQITLIIKSLLPSAGLFEALSFMTSLFTVLQPLLWSYHSSLSFVSLTI